MMDKVKAYWTTVKANKGFVAVTAVIVGAVAYVIHRATKK